MFKYTECRHILVTGRKCHSPALRGKPFCYHDAKLHFRNSRTRKPSEPEQISNLDLHKLRIAVAKALTALSSPLVDTRRAGLLLYGLHLANNVSKRPPAPETPSSIRLEGDGLAATQPGAA